MHGLFDGLFCGTVAWGFIFLVLLFFILKVIGALVCSWWWILLPIFLFLLFALLSSLPGAP